MTEHEALQSIIRRHTTASGYEEDPAKPHIIKWIRIDDADALIADIVAHYERTPDEHHRALDPTPGLRP